MADKGDASKGASPISSGDAEKKRIAELEVANGFVQFDLAIDAIKTFLEPDRPFALRPSLIQQVQAVAVQGIEGNPGQWRSGPVKISKSRHQPPEAHLVPFLVQEMCDYVNNNWHEKTPFHLAAYVMWRLNWIHPFGDGNGRTSRVVSYIVLSTALKTVLNGSPQIPQQIQEDRTTYFHALEDADEKYAQGIDDVTAMELAIRDMLAKQLLSVIEQAGGPLTA
jgi:Fic family protein